MKIEELIARANEAYPDGMIQEAYDGIKEDSLGGCGDTLALFIVRELADTFDEDADDQAQLDEAKRCLRTAVSELEGVIDAL